jgi:hypothetical protein
MPGFSRSGFLLTPDPHPTQLEIDASDMMCLLMQQDRLVGMEPRIA